METNITTNIMHGAFLS